VLQRLRGSTRIHQVISFRAYFARFAPIALFVCFFSSGGGSRGERTETWCEISDAAYTRVVREIT
jgi:hypothetical protein